MVRTKCLPDADIVTAWQTSEASGLSACCMSCALIAALIAASIEAETKLSISVKKDNL